MHPLSRGMAADLDLVDVDSLVLLLHRLVGLLHRVHSRHRVLEILRCHRRLLHVPCLLLQLHELVLVHPLLLERPQCTLLDCILQFIQPSSLKAAHDSPCPAHPVASTFAV